MTRIPAEHAVVLLHGWPVTPAHWRGLLPALRGAGFVPIPVTLPGLGAAPGDTHEFRKSALARGLQEKLARLGHARFAVIGHDWGGTVAALLAAAMPEAVSALVIEEEVLPGIEVDVPAPGADHYPTWHGPFNRAPGLAERLVPGREDAYYGSFLTQSAGPAGLEPVILRSYIDAYRAEGVLPAGLGYYRTRSGDLADVGQLREHPISTPVLAIGGRYAMGSVVADGLRAVATDVRGLVLDESGHYPVEQEPETAARAIVEFLRTRGRS